jgi:hypothetical protein
MPKKEIDAERDKDFNSFKVILPSLPSLIIKYGGLFLKIKRDANKAGKIFQKELIDNGLNESIASKFTSIYLETSNISNYIGIFKKM